MSSSPTKREGRVPPEIRRLSIPLKPGLYRRVKALARRSQGDMSSILVDAVEAVHGRGARYVGLRSAGKGLARLLMRAVLMDNRLAGIAAAAEREERGGWAILLELDALHEELQLLARSVANAWIRVQDVVRDSSGRLGGDMSFDEGGGI